MCRSLLTNFISNDVSIDNSIRDFRFFRFLFGPRSVPSQESVSNVQPMGAPGTRDAQKMRAQNEQMGISDG